MKSIYDFGKYNFFQGYRVPLGRPGCSQPPPGYSSHRNWLRTSWGPCRGPKSTPHAFSSLGAPVGECNFLLPLSWCNLEPPYAAVTPLWDPKWEPIINFKKIRTRMVDISICFNLIFIQCQLAKMGGSLSDLWGSKWSNNRYIWRGRATKTTFGQTKVRQ